MIVGKKLSKVFDILGEVLAILTITLIAFLYLNNTFELLQDLELVALLHQIREYMILGTIVVVGLEFSVKRSFMFFIIFAAIAAVAIIFSFFPNAIPPFLQ